MCNVSVILPSYNHAKYLTKRIESILNQTYKDFELIILDDFSSDNSQEIIEKFRTNIKVSHIEYNKENSGSTFKQWRKGIQLARGNYIWIAESDDLADPFFLELAIKQFYIHPATNLIKFGSKWINASGSVLFQDIELNNPETFHGVDFIQRNMITKNSLENASAIVFKNKDVLPLLDQQVMSFKYCGDWLFWVKILNLGDITIYNKNLNYFRRHTDSVSSRSKRDGLHFLEGIEIYRYLRDNKLVRFNKPFFFFDRIWASNLSNSDSISYITRLKIIHKYLHIRPLIIPFAVFYSLKRLW